MEIRSFIKKVITFLLVVAMPASISNTSVFAADTVSNNGIVKEEVKVGEKLLNSEGYLEQVVRINKDGSCKTCGYKK